MQKIARKTQRREQILDGMFAVMSTAGSLRASVTEIAQSAGIARGALHYYFDSKDEIRVALMERLGSNYTSHLAAALAKRSTPEAKLDILLQFHFGGEAARTHQLMAVWIDFWGQAQSSLEVQQAVFEVQERARALCADVVEALAGPLGDAHRAAGATVLSLIEGGLLQWRVAQGSPHPIAIEDLSDAAREAITALAHRLASHVAPAKGHAA